MAERTAPASRATSDEGTRGPRHLQITLAVIVTMQLMVVLDGTIVNIALPKMRDALHFSATGLSWVITAYALAFGGLLLLGGRAGDVLGRRRMFVVGAAIFTLASLAGGLATSAGMLVAARALQGVGAALAAPSSLSLIATNFAQGPERNRALGVFSTVAGLGLTIGLILGGLLASVSWRWVMFVNVPFGLAIALLAPRFVDEPERHAGRFDIVGAVLSTAGMTSLVYGLVRAASDGWSDTQTYVCLIAAVVLLVVFVAVEMRVAQPVMPLRLFAERTRAGAYLSMLLLPATMSSMFFFLSQFVQVVLGFSPLVAGLAFLPLAATQFAGARYAPKLVPKFGAKPIVLTGTLLTIGASAWLTQISASSGYPGALLGPMLLFGAGVGLCFMPLNMIVMTNMPQKDAGAGSGVLQTMQRVGGSLGVAILVTVYGMEMRHASAHPASGLSRVAEGHRVLAHGIAAAFTGGAGFALLSLLVTLIAVSVKKPVGAKKA